MGQVVFGFADYATKFFWGKMRKKAVASMPQCRAKPERVIRSLMATRSMAAHIVA